jgi:hypothetical protein
VWENEREKERERKRETDRERQTERETHLNQTQGFLLLEVETVRGRQGLALRVALVDDRHTRELEALAAVQLLTPIRLPFQ